jgi:hypothetical protein
MYNVNDILARLQNGESADAIAQSFADALNGALQKQQEEKAMAAKRHEDKVAALTDIIDDVIDFIEEFYPEMIPEGMDFEFSAEDAEDVIKALDDSMPQFIELNAALSSLQTLTKKPEADRVIAKTECKPATFTAAVNGDAISNFLKANGLM